VWLLGVHSLCLSAWLLPRLPGFALPARSGTSMVTSIAKHAAATVCCTIVVLSTGQQARTTNGTNVTSSSVAHAILAWAGNASEKMRAKPMQKKRLELTHPKVPNPTYLGIVFEQHQSGVTDPNHVAVVYGA